MIGGFFRKLRRLTKAEIDRGVVQGRQNGASGVVETVGDVDVVYERCRTSRGSSWGADDLRRVR